MKTKIAVKIPSFLNGIKVELHPQHLSRIQRIDNEDYTDVRVKAQKLLIENGINPSSNYLDAGIVGLKQYYALALLDPVNGHAVSAEIDPFWHAHMLFSEKYMSFSHDVVGGYMHHTPHNCANKKEVKNLRNLYKYTISVLDKIFGESIDLLMWPRKVKDVHLICFHAKDCYLPELEKIKLFDRNAMGDVWAFT